MRCDFERSCCKIEKLLLLLTTWSVLKFEITYSQVFSLFIKWTKMVSSSQMLTRMVKVARRYGIWTKIAKFIERITSSLLLLWTFKFVFYGVFQTQIKSVQQFNFELLSPIFQIQGRMLHLVDITGAVDIAVIVTRWYGGIHLGGDRWKHINNCLRQILEDNGQINRSKKPWRQIHPRAKFSLNWLLQPLRTLLYRHVFPTSLFLFFSVCDFQRIIRKF